MAKHSVATAFRATNKHSLVWTFKLKSSCMHRCIVTRKVPEFHAAHAPELQCEGLVPYVLVPAAAELAAARLCQQSLSASPAHPVQLLSAMSVSCSALCGGNSTAHYCSFVKTATS